MNRDDVIRIAKEAGGEYRGQYDLHQMTSAELERFANLIASHVAEECAKVCKISDDLEDWEILGGQDGRELCNGLAASIRELYKQTAKT